MSTGVFTGAFMHRSRPLLVLVALYLPLASSFGKGLGSWRPESLNNWNSRVQQHTLKTKLRTGGYRAAMASTGASCAGKDKRIVFIRHGTTFC